MNRNFFKQLVVVSLLASFFGSTAVRGADDEDAVPNAEIAKLIEQISESDGAAHRTATDKLLKIGVPAVAPLAKAAETERVIVVIRCFDSLQRMLVADDEKTAAAAQESLEKLSDSAIRRVAVRAKNSLRLKEVYRNREALLKGAAPAVGAGVTRMTFNDNGKTTHLERADDGSFTGKMTETINGKDQETEIKAATEKELEEKFPEAHKSFQKQQQRQQQFGGPVPGFPPPGNLPPGFRVPGIQINGFGGAGVQTKISINGGKRHIESSTGDEKVTIDDTNGKDIVLKHTRTVDGKAKTDEYKGTDLDDLKKKHPEAARLYEKYGAANNVVVGGGGALQLQIGAPRGVLLPRAQFRGPDQFGPEVLPNNPAGPRTIRAEQDGRKIEITDEDGKNIKVKLIKVVNGKDVGQEFSAEDLASLKSEHPEAAKLYEQLTGRKAE